MGGRVKRAQRVREESCAGCHERREGKEGALCAPWRLGRSFRVGRAFDHAVHRFDPRRPPQTPLSCAQCHKGVAESGGRDAKGVVRPITLLTPKAMTRACGECHSGRLRFGEGPALFSVNDPKACARCHPQIRFSATQTAQGHGKVW